MDSHPRQGEWYSALYVDYTVGIGPGYADSESRMCAGVVESGIVVAEHVESEVDRVEGHILIVRSVRAVVHFGEMVRGLGVRRWMMMRDVGVRV